jgi:choline dehydrogenase
MATEGYRYVIVGAGSAGCVLANRLSADPACRVALLEAGGPDRKREIRIPLAATRLFQSAYDWNYRTSKQPQMSDREMYLVFRGYAAWLSPVSRASGNRSRMCSLGRPC